MSLPSTVADIQRRMIDHGFWASIHSRLAARSRVTNLGVLLLSLALVLSLLWNTRSKEVVVTRPATSEVRVENSFGVGNIRKMLPPSPAEGNTPLTHLIVVAGHAIWSMSSFAEHTNLFQGVTMYRKSPRTRAGSLSLTSEMVASRRSFDTFRKGAFVYKATFTQSSVVQP